MPDIVVEIRKDFETVTDTLTNYLNENLLS